MFEQVVIECVVLERCPQLVVHGVGHVLRVCVDE
jgi:hypothetical protein